MTGKVNQSRVSNPYDNFSLLVLDVNRILDWKGNVPQKVQLSRSLTRQRDL